MAHPRIFISSTYYDLKSARADLEQYIKARGFDPVLNERGHIPYGSDTKIEEYCYREIQNCDILVSIVGGRFGSASHEDPYSISQKELKTAIDLARPVYIFVEKSVLAEYETYKRNKDAANNLEYAAVDDVAIYRFLDEIFALPLNNSVAPFETSSDITAYLQEQWSGLFHSLLQDAARRKEAAHIEDLQSTAKTLRQLVTFLTEERRKGDQAIRDILLSNHPMFETIRTSIGAPYRVFFTNRDEMVKLLKARQYRGVTKQPWDSDAYDEWICDRTEPHRLLKVAVDVFDENGRLKIFTPEEWDREWVTSEELAPKIDDDIPF